MNLKRIKINKKALIVLLILVLVSGLFWAYNAFKNRIVAKEFVGKIERIEGNVIYANGLFVAPDHPELLGASNATEVKITVTASTKLIKALVRLPSDEELKKTGGYFDGSQLPREYRDINLETMIKELEHRDIIAEFRADKNIYRRKEFEALEVKYTVRFLPELDN